MKKRLLSCIVVLCMLLTTILAGCGSSGKETKEETKKETKEETKEEAKEEAKEETKDESNGSAKTEKEIHFACWWSEAEIEIAQKWLDENFTPESGIKVVIDYYPYDGFTQKMLSMIAADSAPDLFIAEEPSFAAYYNANVLLSLSDYCERDGIDLTSTHEGTSNYVCEGELYGYPFWYGCTYMFVNTDMVEAAGYEVPRDHWTWDELREISLACTNEEDGTYGFVQYFHSGSHMWYYLNGASVFNDDFSECTINSNAMVNAMEFNRKLIYEDKVSPEPSLYATTPADTMFRDGKAAFMLNGTWATNYLRSVSDQIDFNWDVIYAPNGPDSNGKETISWTGPIVVPASAKDPDACWEFLKYWSTSEGINALTVGAMSAFPVTEETIEMEEYYTYPEQLPKSFNKEFITHLIEDAVPENFSHVYFNENVNNAMLSIQDILLENKDAQKVCDDAYDAIMAEWDNIVSIPQ